MMCCFHGKVDINGKIPSTSAEYILNLWSKYDIEGKIFRNYSRKKNSAISSASFLASEAEVRKL